MLDDHTADDQHRSNRYEVEATISSPSKITVEFTDGRVSKFEVVPIDPWCGGWATVIVTKIIKAEDAPLGVPLFPVDSQAKLFHVTLEQVEIVQSARSLVGDRGPFVRWHFVSGALCARSGSARRSPSRYR